MYSMIEDFYRKMTSPGTHASPSFQQKILTDWLDWITHQATIKTALDLGSGLGFNLPALSPFCSQVWATDISQKALTEAQKNNRILKNIKYMVCAAQNLKFPTSHFDLIVCTEVLEHLENQKGVINEVAKVLKPGGFLLISTPNYLNLTGLIKFWHDRKAGRQYWEPWGAHTQGVEKHMTPYVLYNLLSQKFKIVKTQVANYLLAWLYPLPAFRKHSDRFPLLSLGKLPFLKNFGMQYYILAQKK